VWKRSSVFPGAFVFATKCIVSLLKSVFIHLPLGCILNKFIINGSYDIFYHHSVLDIGVKNCDYWYLA